MDWTAQQAAVVCGLTVNAFLAGMERERQLGRDHRSEPWSWSEDGPRWDAQAVTKRSERRRQHIVIPRHAYVELLTAPGEPETVASHGAAAAAGEGQTVAAKVMPIS